MRSHQLTPGKVAGLYSAIVPLSTDPVSPPIAEKLRSPSYQGEGWGATVQEEITENSIHNLHGSSPHLKQQQQESSLVIARFPKEKPTIAPPVFIFQKAERPLKRSAENSRLENAGLGAILEKRGRSSSFTFSGSGCQSQADSSSRDKRVRSSSFNCTATSFPPQPAPRNNVFMPSSLSMINTERGNFTPESIPVPSNGKKNVIRPATLPAPQLQSITFPAANEAAPGSSIGASCLPQRDEKGHQKVTLEPVCLQANYDANRESACSPFLHLSTKEISRKCLDQEMSGREANLEFVFGENMSERVLSPVKPSFSEDSESDDSSDEETTSSGTESSCSETYCKIVKHRTLRESAAAYTAASSQRCLLEEVDVFTGEEDESNVLQMTCKLFVFEKATQTWLERGRGVLRLNDKVAEGAGCLQSRLVMRNQGSLKLILNSRLWAQMHLHRASRKMLRFTAVDLEDQTVRVFLVQATLKEVTRLYVAIHHRLVLLQNCAKKNQENQLSPRKLQPQSGVPVLNYDSEKEDEDEDDEEEEEEKLVRIACPRSGQSKWSRSGTRSQAGICT